MYEKLDFLSVAPDGSEYYTNRLQNVLIRAENGESPSTL